MLTFTFRYKNGQAVTLSDKLSYDNLDRIGIDSCVVERDGKPYFILHFEPEQKPIYRMRVEQAQGGKTAKRIHLLGWRKGSEQSINYFIDGVIYQAGKFDPEDPRMKNPRNPESWFYTPNIRVYEQ